MKKKSSIHIYYALTQAQFNPIMALMEDKHEYIGNIQDQLRQKGYTLFEQASEKQFQFSDLSQPPQVKDAKISLFIKADRSAGFILRESSLTYHTTHYQARDAFLSELLSGLKIVHQVVKLDHLSRLGLRYLAAILPGSHETVDDYLVNKGPVTSFDTAPQRASSEWSFETDTQPLVAKGGLLLRLTQLRAPLGYPLGLMPMGLSLDTETMAHALIDSDHFVAGQMPLDFKKIEAQLISLNDGNRQALRGIIGKHSENLI